MARYLRPGVLGEALEALDRGTLTILAGGTDFYPARVARFLDEDVMDVTGLQGMGEIEESADHFHLGCLVTWSDLCEASLPAWFDGLKLAAREVGGLQIQNAGTIVGNICNASPAADGVPCLMAMDARIELVSAGGRRVVLLTEYIAGNRRTVRHSNELVTGIVVPKPANPAHGTFLKLGARKYLVISIAMVAAVIESAGDGSVAAARVAVGACSEVARRLPVLEAALSGRAISPALGDVAAAEHLDILQPIDDVRGTAAYRSDAALTLVRRALGELGGAV